MVRHRWKNLNGLWDYAITGKDETINTKYDGKILVPFPSESALSGVKTSLQPDQLLWYKRMITLDPRPGEKQILHFGAVDWQATVYVNGIEVGMHSGGYTAFSFDITKALQKGENELMIKVLDPTNRGIGPHGKQDLDPANIYYTPSSGIWQTVWMETVPEDYIESLTITPDIDSSMVVVTVNSRTNTSVKINMAGETSTGKTNIAIKIPVKNSRLWSPDDPYLYALNVIMGDDKVNSYFGMRKISIGKDEKGFDRIMLNNKYIYNLGTLDQGFWPDGLYTAPTDEALKFDIKAIKAMGFNTIRKHIKVEPARWYYYADKLGIMVWQDLVNPNQGLPEGAKKQFERETTEILKQLHNFPSITTWVLFNEKWGAYDQERLTKWLKLTDPSRLVNGHSGEYLYVNGELRSPSPNAYAEADMTDVHSYPNPMMPEKQAGKAWVCGEFGGIGVAVAGHQWNDITGWGYVQVRADELADKYEDMVNQLKKMEKQGLSASIYTQPFDVEGEENGLMTYDREIIKISIKKLREIHSNLIDLTDNKLEKKFFIAKDIDKDDNDNKYPDFQADYIKGKRDSAFLRRLVLMAIRKKDSSSVRTYGHAYGLSLKDKFSYENLIFIKDIIKSPDDFGFKFFMENITKVNAVLGENEVEARLTSIIDDNRIKPKIRSGKLDWDLLTNELTTKYGEIGEEAAWQARIFYDANNALWDDFGLVVGPWFSKYGKNRKWIGFNMLNRLAWAIFENVDNKAALEGGALMTAKALQMENHPNVMDTHANLLYKLGKKDQALELQSQAANLAPDNQDIQQNLDKMKKNMPTWPQKK
jgi:hypothetical protein